MTTSWLSRYVDPLPIRCRGGLHFYACREAASGEPVVIVEGPSLPVDEARAQLGDLAHAHDLAAGPCVPAVRAAETSGPSPWVALACDGVADLEGVTDHVQREGDAPPFELTSAIGLTAMETLARTHDIVDPRSGRPVCLGSMSPGNLMFSRDGAFWMVGFGAGPLAGAIVAPEVAAGGEPTPGADLYALTLLLRSLLGFTQLPPVIRRVFSGDVAPGDAPRLLGLLAWSNLRILAGAPSARPAMTEALAKARQMWRILGFEPDVVGFRRRVATWLSGEPGRVARAAPADGAPAGFALGPEGDWLETPDGARHALGRRSSLRRVVLCLARARVTGAGRPVTVEDLLAAGWPGERPIAEAGSNRVWVALSTLRKMGLGDVLQRWDGGYRLDPAVPFRAA